MNYPQKSDGEKSPLYKVGKPEADDHHIGTFLQAGIAVKTNHKIIEGKSSLPPNVQGENEISSHGY